MHLGTAISFSLYQFKMKSFILGVFAASELTDIFLPRYEPPFIIGHTLWVGRSEYVFPLFLSIETLIGDSGGSS